MEWIVIIIVCSLWGYLLGIAMGALGDRILLLATISFIGLAIAVGVGLKYTIGEVEYMGSIDDLSNKDMLILYRYTAVIFLCTIIALIFGNMRSYEKFLKQSK